MQFSLNILTCTTVPNLVSKKVVCKYYPTRGYIVNFWWIFTESKTADDLASVFRGFLPPALTDFIRLLWPLHIFNYIQTQRSGHYERVPGRVYDVHAAKDCRPQAQRDQEPRQGGAGPSSHKTGNCTYRDFRNLHSWISCALELEIIQIELDRNIFKNSKNNLIPRWYYFCFVCTKNIKNLWYVYDMFM